MTHFADLTPYSYGIRSSDRVLNVGWLARGFPFPTAMPSQQLLSALFRACKIRVNQTRGFHRCDFCTPIQQGLTRAMWEDEELLLGSAEIRVSIGAVTFAAPDLIFHYTSVHHYDPPLHFCMRFSSLHENLRA